jgi:hypothetical protein
MGIGLEKHGLKKTRGAGTKLRMIWENHGKMLGKTWEN